MDQSLDVLSDELDPGRFFRISRSCIIAMPAIVSIVKYLGNRLKITARPRPEFEMVVSRSRVDDFLKWLGGGSGSGGRGEFRRGVPLEFSAED